MSYKIKNFFTAMQREHETVAVASYLRCDPTSSLLETRILSEYLEMAV